MPKFQIQQIAVSVPYAKRAEEFLAKIGLTEWFHDHVVASGQVFCEGGTNEADLRFNYQAGSGSDAEAAKPLELEILDYTSGDNWISANIDNGNAHPEQVSHLGMHVTAEELLEWREFMESEGVGVAQEVVTQSHTNPAIKDSRRYNYVIFDTREIIGVDLKFIVRLPYAPE